MKLKLNISVLTILILFSCQPPNREALNENPAQTDLALTEYLSSQVKYGLTIHNKQDTVSYPRSTERQEIFYAPTLTDWTVGFYPGVLWQTYQLTGDEELKKEAIKYTMPLKPLEGNSSTHDLGFMINCSFGEAYKATGDKEYLTTLINTAQSLVKRYDPTVGCLKSWDGDVGGNGWVFPVIIDNMMNLELLFKATEHTGDSSFYQIAVKHANTTLREHFRPDHSTYHVVDYDPETGLAKRKNTHQGFDHNSDWARGQSWALYGYTVCYRYTKDTSYLEQAKTIAQFLFDHPGMPDDLIPYWDLKDPDIPNAPRDASAAAIIASALYELSQYAENEMYSSKADAILNSLRSNQYLAEIGTNAGFILLHSVGNKPENSEIDAAINYADYYYLEALNRQKTKTTMRQIQTNNAK